MNEKLWNYFYTKPTVLRCIFATVNKRIKVINWVRCKKCPKLAKIYVCKNGVGLEQLVPMLRYFQLRKFKYWFSLPTCIDICGKTTFLLSQKMFLKVISCNQAWSILQWCKMYKKTKTTYCDEFPKGLRSFLL